MEGVLLNKLKELPASKFESLMRVAPDALGISSKSWDRTLKGERELKFKEAIRLAELTGFKITDFIPKKEKEAA